VVKAPLQNYVFDEMTKVFPMLINYI